MTLLDGGRRQAPCAPTSPRTSTRLLATQRAKDWLRTIIETYLPDQPAAGHQLVDSGQVPDLRHGAARRHAARSRRSSSTTRCGQRQPDRPPGVANGVPQRRPRAAASTRCRSRRARRRRTSSRRRCPPTSARASSPTPASSPRARRSDGRRLVVPRGKAIISAVLCLPPDRPPTPSTCRAAPVDQARGMFDTQTSQQQVAFRASSRCAVAATRSSIPYGLVLECYDKLGRYRTTDDQGMPADAHSTLPAELGGGSMTSAIDLAEKLASNPLFTDCMAKHGAAVRDDRPLGPGRAAAAAPEARAARQPTSWRATTPAARQDLQRPGARDDGIARVHASPGGPIAMQLRSPSHCPAAPSEVSEE